MTSGIQNSAAQLSSTPMNRQTNLGAGKTALCQTVLNLLPLPCKAGSLPMQPALTQSQVLWFICFFSPSHC